VGEVNVVEMMEAQGAVIGGEGNGGVIYPRSHPGRDAVVGTALFLTHYVRKGLTCSALRDSYPRFAMSKDKMSLPSRGVEEALEALVTAHPDAQVNRVDGVKFDLPEGWVHLRRSNTEPILRIYAEAPSAEGARALGDRFKGELEALLATGLA
jgi:phosphomannomutase